MILITDADEFYNRCRDKLQANVNTQQGWRMNNKSETFVSALHLTRKFVKYLTRVLFAAVRFVMIAAVRSDDT